MINEAEEKIIPFNNPTITSLPAGTYILDVTDNNGCISSQAINIIDPACNVTVSTSVVEPTCNGGLGSISWNTIGGIAPYTTIVTN